MDAPPTVVDDPRPLVIPPYKRMLRGSTGPVLIIVLVILALWYALVPVMNADVVRVTTENGEEMSFAEILPLTFELERPVLPSPHQVAGELYKTVFETAVTSRRSLLNHAWVTLSSTLVGFGLGVVGGILLAIAIVHSRLLDKSLMPWIIASQTVPILAVAPIIIVVLGSVGITGLLPKSLISAYLSFFPVAIGMVKGLTSPDALQLDLMRTYNASRLATLLKLRMPSAVPFLFASLKVSIAISLLGAIVGELPTGAQAGIGARLLAGSYYGQTIQIWAALFMSAFLAAGLIVVVGMIERGVSLAMGGRR